MTSRHINSYNRDIEVGVYRGRVLRPHSTFTRSRVLAPLVLSCRRTQLKNEYKCEVYLNQIDTVCNLPANQNICDEKLSIVAVKYYLRFSMSKHET